MTRRLIQFQHHDHFQVGGLGEHVDRLDALWEIPERSEAGQIARIVVIPLSMAFRWASAIASGTISADNLPNILTQK